MQMIKLKHAKNMCKMMFKSGVKYMLNRRISNVNGYIKVLLKYYQIVHLIVLLNKGLKQIRTID